MQYNITIFCVILYLVQNIVPSIAYFNIMLLLRISYKKYKKRVKTDSAFVTASCFKKQIPR